ncbi:MAG: hypothetical protein BGO77_02705 [Caedibacter sp. 37-49]|nr:MAG: hypothetical protein BGO77_02705 [Caedibacter sp. 37-49]
MKKKKLEHKIEAINELIQNPNQEVSIIRYKSDECKKLLEKFNQENENIKKKMREELSKSQPASETYPISSSSTPQNFKSEVLRSHAEVSAQAEFKKISAAERHQLRQERRKDKTEAYH